MKKLLVGTSMVALATALAAPAFAQSTVGEVIVTGTRTTGVKAADSAAPIEVVGSVALSRTGTTDLASSLETTVPSLNIQTTGGDMAALSIQAALRGLSPNDTLVLIDGKRRHTTSNLAVDGGSPYSGAATTDLAFVPEGAIDHIEVLTDGAAAQYGTDAIAGVVNIILKKAADGGQIVGTGGQDYNSQGKTGAWSLNKGFTIGDKGFANVTLEERYHEYTTVGIGDSRIQNPDGSPASGLSFPNNNVTGTVGYPVTNKLNGDPAFNIYNGMYNAGYDINDEIQLYSFGSYGYRVAEHFENLRLPSKVEGCTSTLVTCNLGSNTPVYGVTYNVLPFPHGFDPSEQIKETDYSWTGGIKGDVSGWHYDLSSTYGADINDIYVINSANAQLFPVLQAQSATAITPQTTFYNGTFKTTEWSNELDIDNSFAVGLASPLNVAFGIEGRRETYGITAGEPSSYYGAGAQSFDGYTPLDQGEHSRTNYGVYVDLAADVVKGWNVDLAGRYEHYSDFGGTTTGKLTTRYDFNPMFAVRGTISTGFRAPTLAEEYYSGTNVSPYSADVQLPPNSTAAQVAGFQPLKPEKSTNYSVGFVAHPIDRLQITADVYDIELKNRILVSGFIYGTNTIGGSIVTISPGVLAAIAAKGVTLDSGLSYTGISVFANAADTRTTGLEATANYASDFGDMGHVDWSVGFNYNHTEITKLVPLPTQVANPAYFQTAILSPNAKTALTNATPEEKAILQAYWTKDKFSVNLRETVYGPSSEIQNSGYNEKIPTTGITDLDVGYKITKMIKIDLGANNLFNTIPPHAPTVADSGGRVYNVPYLFSPYGVNGGYYYGRVTVNF
jgi:iron complex outermembrane receptor protein